MSSNVCLARICNFWGGSPTGSKNWTQSGLIMRPLRVQLLGRFGGAVSRTNPSSNQPIAYPMFFGRDPQQVPRVGPQVGPFNVAVAVVVQQDPRAGSLCGAVSKNIFFRIKQLRIQVFWCGSATGPKNWTQSGRIWCCSCCCCPTGPKSWTQSGRIMHPLWVQLLGRFGGAVSNKSFFGIGGTSRKHTKQNLETVTRRSVSPQDAPTTLQNATPPRLSRTPPRVPETFPDVPSAQGALRRPQDPPRTPPRRPPDALKSLWGESKMPQKTSKSIIF